MSRLPALAPARGMMVSAKGGKDEFFLWQDWAKKTMDAAIRNDWADILPESCKLVIRAQNRERGLVVSHRRFARGEIARAGTLERLIGMGTMLGDLATCTLEALRGRPGFSCTVVSPNGLQKTSYLLRIDLPDLTAYIRRAIPPDLPDLR